MADITKELETLRSSEYEGELRSSIHKALKKMNDEPFDSSQITDGSIARSKVDEEFEATLAKADGAMQKSVYDPVGYGNANPPIDPYTYAQARKNEVQGVVDAMITEIIDAYSVYSDSQQTDRQDFTSLGNAVRGAYAKAIRYANALLADYKPITIRIVQSLPAAGEDRTFYLIPKQSGTGYDKYWYIRDDNDNQFWDAFGASSTVVVDSLPATGEADVDYILRSPAGYLYYKYINNQWEIIAGSIASVLDELPEEGNELTDYYILNESGVYVHYRYIDGDFHSIGTESYTPAEIDSMLASLSTDISRNASNISANATNITSLSQTVDRLAQELAGIDTEGVRYSLTLDTEDNTNYYLTLHETEKGVEEIVSQFLLPATGGGGGGSSSTLVVDKITPSPFICTPTDSVILEIDYSSHDGDGEDVDGTYILKRGSAVVMSGNLVQGRNSFDVTEYSSVGTQKYTLTVTDAGGSVSVKSWTVQVADVRLESAFNDRYTYAIGQSVNFTYTPYGAIPKTVHFKLDGVELESVSTSASGTLQSYSLSPQTHGAHLLECWITATVSSTNIETQHIFKDIIWYDETSEVPVIGCIYRYDHYGQVTAKQYNTTTIPYIVYDPKSSAPTVTLEVDDEVVSTLRITTSANNWAYKTDEIAVHVLKIRCGVTVVEIRMNIVELGYDIEPITANLQFDFNPVGRSNSSANRLWEDENHPEIKMSVSENFDWDNGGYQLDSDGNQYFCVKAGTSATISYNLFGVDPKQAGAEFKVIFRTENVRDPDATFLTCLPPQAETQVGLQMNVHGVDLKSSSDTLTYPYSEEDTIEFEYNIDILDTEDPNATSIAMLYEDGVASRALIYNDSHRFYQYTPSPISIGSEDCDVHIYRMKAYSSTLTYNDILSNFVADARDSDTMIARYERNQIFDENGNVTPESIANSCPDLKVLKIECPHFTNDKKDYVKNTSIECIHKNGDAALDNWVVRNAYHVGQGTTSNRYGLAGRNIDIIFGFDGVHQVVSKIPLDPTYISEVTLGDGTSYTDGSGKIALTRTSVPNTWFNIKVNIASSENANNALLQKRYNEFLPYKTPAMNRNPFVKNSMEFVNCVVFVKESDPDISTHREFSDTAWHFYAIGNLGDSKKTDNTRVNDPEDMSEFVVEISDNTLPNATFDTGYYRLQDGRNSYVYADGAEIIYPITQAQWNNPANTKRDSLYNSWDDSFEFRYDMNTRDGETIPDSEIEAQQLISKQVFRDMYEFVITSTDEDFVAHLSDWFIVESPLFWYLFTERYLMTDNRAKNSFWHWGKTYITEVEAVEIGDDAANYTIDNTAAAINNGYRFDLWDYDNDTALGIDNNGELTMTYGYEDIDLKPDGGPVYNGSESVFWKRIRGLMGTRLRSLYQNLESLNCWTASSSIAEWDAWQDQFPEELWRLDIERKYLRPYYVGNPVAGIEPTNDFLQNMANGKKKYQRRQFERNQEVYIGTKYFGTNQCADSRAISFRCNTPTGAVVSPNYTIRVIPYSDMYLSLSYGNSTPQQVRAKAGTEYTFTTDMTTMDDTQILIYCAENIMALNDLSACYIRANNFAYARRLKTLVIGSDVEGYSNPFITALSMGNNALLETLDIRNCPNLSGSINLSSCVNLETLLAEGTALQSVTFAQNGNIESAHLPETISTLSFRSITRLTDLDVESYDNLETFICEYSDIDALEILTEAIDTLQTIRILGIDWTLPETTILNQCLEMNSSLISGSVYLSGAVREQELLRYAAAWPDLEVTYDPAKIVTQYQATYVNYDGTTLYSVYIDRGSSPIDPVALELIPTPTREPTAQYTFLYSGWDDIESVMLTNRTITAQYTESIRSYTVRWYSLPGLLWDTLTVNYGQEAVCPKGIPTNMSEEATYVYNLFKQWDKSTGYVTENIDTFAVWDRAALPQVGKDLSEMSLPEIYGVCQAGMAEDYFTEGDHFDITLGQDFNFSNVESREILRDRFFDGTEYYDTNIKLFDVDSPSFTMVIDYEFLEQSDGATLVACYEEEGHEGFRLKYRTSTNRPSQIEWGNLTNAVHYLEQRAVLVLRHVRNSTRLWVYMCNLSNGFLDSYEYTLELVRNRSTQTDQILTFGSMRYSDGTRDYYAKGWIYRCKIWYDDLGNDVSKKMASWVGEKIRMRYTGANRYRLSGSTSVRANGHFEAVNLIQFYSRMNPTDTNDGGWDASHLREVLHVKLYPAFSYEILQAIKEVRVPANPGNGSFEISYSNEKIFPLAVREYGGFTSEPYISEGEPISYYTTNLSRVKFTLPILSDNPQEIVSDTDPTLMESYSVSPGDIWINTAKGSVEYTYVSKEIADKHSTIGYTPIVDSYECLFASDGGIWFIARSYWTRSARQLTNTDFLKVSNDGNQAVASTASTRNGIAFSFCI